MRKLLRDRRGAISFVAVATAIPLIGAVALGAEASAWYVTKQHAQNAADAAAYSAALWIASPETGTPTMDYRGKQFAAQHAFCKTGDTVSYPGRACGTLPTGITQDVVLTRGTYSAGSFTANASGNAVQAAITQIEPRQLSAVLSSGNVTIGATAVALVSNPSNPCMLALNGPITFQDNGVSINAPGCGMASNYTGPGPSIDFGPVKASNITIGQGSAAGGCTGNATLCSKVSTYSPPVTDPYNTPAPPATLPSNCVGPSAVACGMNAAINALSLPACSGSAPVAYTAATPCANNNFSMNGSTSYTLSGTYFFSGTEFTMKGASSNLQIGANGATLILLPGVSMGKNSNHITLTLKAQTTTPTATNLPLSLQPYADLIGKTAIYDPETDSQKFTGGASITVNNGILYYPNESLTFSGNSNLSLTCAELIAKSIKFAGSNNFTQSGCSATTKPVSQIVALVQ